MSNSSPTILERIRRAAMDEAYANARRLGYAGEPAAREAWMVYHFINSIAESVNAIR